MIGVREQLADLEHDRWSRWMAYLFSKGAWNSDGSFTIDAGSVAHWRRQMTTAYIDLSEPEKNSDRKEADRTIALLEVELPSRLSQVPSEVIGDATDRNDERPAWRAAVRAVLRGY